MTMKPNIRKKYMMLGEAHADQAAENQIREDERARVLAEVKVIIGQERLEWGIGSAQAKALETLEKRLPDGRD